MLVSYVSLTLVLWASMFAQVLSFPVPYVVPPLDLATVADWLISW